MLYYLSISVNIHLNIYHIHMTQYIQYKNVRQYPSILLFKWCYMSSWPVDRRLVRDHISISIPWHKWNNYMHQLIISITYHFTRIHTIPGIGIFEPWKKSSNTFRLTYFCHCIYSAVRSQRWIIRKNFVCAKNWKKSIENT